MGGPNIFCSFVQIGERDKRLGHVKGRRMFYKTRNPFDRDVTRDKYTKNSDSAVSRINPTTCIQQSVRYTESLQAVFRISCFLYQCFCISCFVYRCFYIRCFVYQCFLNQQQCFFYQLFLYLY